MFKILMLSGAVLFMSMTVQADDTVETCASGAGIVVTGKSGHKYCKSNGSMNYWNSYTWCEAQGRRMLDWSDCGCNVSTYCGSGCPEFSGIGGDINFWLANPKGERDAYVLYMGNATINGGLARSYGGTLIRTVCY